jgi:hypothetical protein
MKPLLQAIFLCVVTSTMSAENKPIIRDLPKAAVEHMERQRGFVADLALKNSLDHKLTGTEADFDLIQEVLDKHLLRQDQKWELQSLGIVFGDALIATIAGLRWYEVSDAWGTDPAIFYKDTSWQLNPLTMISKRVERGERDFDVRSLADKIAKDTLEKADYYDKR